jgi:3'(2'), 5'-bisphosphate nucleotidase
MERLALAAGEIVLRLRAEGVTADRKADLSPVTEADRAAERAILAGLRAEFPGIPVVGEEEAAAGLAPRQLGRQFFLVDPLDGTRDFLAGRPDFTVNLALVRDGMPALGAVFAPAHGELFAGGGKSAWRRRAEPGRMPGLPEPIAARTAASPPVILVSRSHRTAETDAWLARYPHAVRIALGSSLKFCRLAAGEADLYPRLGTTMAWDTAAGDAILRAAGGSTRTLEGAPLAYGTIGEDGRPVLANPSFIARGRNTL